MSYLKWKRINEFLEVSENGQVKSHGKLICGEVCKNGYIRIHVSNNGVVFKLLVHRLVAQAFIPNPDNLPCVNHLDGNKANNVVENLEWCTYSRNSQHAYDIGLRDLPEGERNTQHKLTETQVLEIRRTYVKGKHSEYNSYGLANKYGVTPRTIQDIVKRKTWKHVLG